MSLFEFLSSTAGGKAIIHITQFSLTWMLAWLPFGIPMSIRFQWLPFKPLMVPQKLILLLPLYAIAVPILAAWVHRNGNLLSDFGLTLNSQFMTSGIAGLGLGLVSFALLLGVEKSLGWISIRFSNLLTSPDTPESNNALVAPILRLGVLLAGLLTLSLIVSFVEELLFRGFLWGELRPAFTIGGSALVSSIIFAVLHLIWEGWIARSQLGGLTLMGLVLCIARWVDQDTLGLAWGLHAGWIWAIASLDALQCLEHSPTAPVWLVGKPGQPLTGLLTLSCLFGTGLLMFLNHATPFE